ncbi:hypothetical protein GE09DRAFT_1140758 [Coniochaeta sp. 2T2.1]|nr:hypothetical protein GE09DRAFT_1140758 [Coniochaeta sp. 2T2.1]
MIETIVEEGKVEDASGMDFYLWHSDLLPRNIMVDVDSTPMITGIIDWDEAVYAPKFATALAPWWLWELPPPEEEQEKKPEGEDDDPYTYHVDPMEDEETFEKVDSEPPELAAVKRAWEEAIGPEYAESAMSHYAILARRVLRFSLAWQWAYWWQDLYSQTLAEWKALRPVEESEEESDDDSDDSDDDSDDSEDASEDGSEDEENPEAEAGDIPEDDGDEIWESYSEDEDEDDA